MRAASLLAGCALLAASVPAAAHGLDHRVTGDRAVVVTLTYDDGAPFSFESCEVTPPAQDTPSQVGRTDRRGRVVFLPDRAGDWRVRVMAEDGQLIEVQGTAEGAPFSRAQLTSMLDLAEVGIRALTAAQRAAVG